MAKKESTFANMLLTLAVITLVSSTSLGYVYEITKEPKAAAELSKKTFAIKKVVPEFTNSPIKDMYSVKSPDGAGMLEFYPAYKDSVLVGTAVKTFSTQGYGGMISIMVGFNPEGTIYNLSVLEQKETPGLGTKMVEPKFQEQFLGKNPLTFKLKVKKDDGDVDAITAATVSSRAFNDAVQRAYDTYVFDKEENSNGKTK